VLNTQAKVNTTACRSLLARTITEERISDIWMADPLLLHTYNYNYENSM